MFKWSNRLGVSFIGWRRRRRAKQKLLATSSFNSLTTRYWHSTDSAQTQNELFRLNRFKFVRTTGERRTQSDDVVCVIVTVRCVRRAADTNVNLCDWLGDGAWLKWSINCYVPGACGSVSLSTRFRVPPNTIRSCRVGFCPLSMCKTSYLSRERSLAVIFLLAEWRRVCKFCVFVRRPIVCPWEEHRHTRVAVASSDHMKTSHTSNDIIYWQFENCVSWNKNQNKRANKLKYRRRPICFTHHQQQHTQRVICFFVVVDSTSLFIIIITQMRWPRKNTQPRMANRVWEVCCVHSKCVLWHGPPFNWKTKETIWILRRFAAVFFAHTQRLTTSLSIRVWHKSRSHSSKLLI